MLGFELCYNEKVVSVPIGKRSITIFVTKKDESIFLNFSGTDFQSSETTTWYDSDLHLGDHLTIKVKEVEEESQSINKYKLEVMSEDSEEVEKKRNHSELKRFYYLKEILSNKGLI